MNRILRALQSHLPLRVDQASWAPPNLSIYGPEWSLNGMCAWRVINHGIVVGASGSQDSESSIALLAGKCLVRASIQSVACPPDPVLFFDDGHILELFSDDVLEPWVMRLPAGEVFVANPGVREWLYDDRS